MSAVRMTWSRIFRGGRNGRHRAAAVFLALVAGAVAGWNLSCAALLLTALCLNTSPTWLAAGFACGLGWSVWGANLHHAVGAFFLDKLRLSAVLDGLTDHPLLAMFRLDEYLVFGGAATAALAALPAAHLAARFGGRRPAATSTAADVDPWLRPWALPSTALAALGLFALVQTVGPRRAADALLERLSVAAQVPVAADRADYDLWSGELSLTGLRFGDAGDPGRIGLEIDQLTTRVEPKLFLGGRLHAAEMTLSGVRWSCDSVAGRADATSPLGPMRLQEGSASTYVDDPTRAIEVHDLLRHRERWNLHLRALGRLIAAVECVADLESSRSEAQRRLQADELRFASQASAGGRGAPLVRVKRLRVVDLHDLTELSAHAQLELTNLTSRPAEAARHAQLTLGDGGDAFRLDLTFHLSDGARRHEASFAVRRTAACDLLQLGPAAPVDLQHAVLESVRGQGRVTRERFDIRTSVDVAGARLQPKVETLAGLAGELWRQGLAQMPQWHFAVDFAGRWTEPSVRLLPAAIVADFKHQLRTAGAHELVRAIESKPTSSAATEIAASPRPSPSTAVAGVPKGPDVAASAASTTPVIYPKTATPEAGRALSLAAASTTTSMTPGAMPVAAESQAVRQVAAVAAVDDASAPAPSAAARTPKPPTVVAQVAAGGPAIVPPIVEMPSAPAENFNGPRRSDDAPNASPAQPSRLDALPSLPHRSLVSAAGRSAPPAFAGDADAAPAAVAADRTRAPADRPATSQAAPPRGPVPARMPAGTGFATDETSQALQAEDRRATSPYPTTGAPPLSFGPAPLAEPRGPSTAGLRQPLGVAEPSAMPGAMNLSTGYDQPSRRRGAPAAAAEGPSFGGRATPAPGASSVTGPGATSLIPPPATTSPRRYDRPREAIAEPYSSADPLPDEVEEPEPTSKPLLGALTTLFGKRPTGAGPRPSMANRHSVHVDEPTPETSQPPRTGILPKVRTWFNRTPKSEPNDLGPVDPGPYINDGSDATNGAPGASYAVQSDYESEESERSASSSAAPRPTAARIPTAPEAESAATLKPREARSAATAERSTAAAPSKLPPPRDLPADGEPSRVANEALSADRVWYDRLLR